jgi:hypothetical protein
MNRAHGIRPRDAVEELAWPVLKGKVFAEAGEIFLRLLRGDVLCSDEVQPTVLRRGDFRSDEHWARVQEAAGTKAAQLEVARRWSFEPLKIVPQEWRRELLELIVGSHDPALQESLNRILPVKVFNLSITRPEVIDETHRRMQSAFHPAGGPWRRQNMPRTVFVFLNEQPGLGPDERRARAHDEARAALGAYWTALEGTLDPKKLDGAADNALIGNAEDVASQMLERFDPEDRLMLWFDFFNHDCARVIQNMEAFMSRVAPRVHG